MRFRFLLAAAMVVPLVVACSRPERQDQAPRELLKAAETPDTTPAADNRPANQFREGDSVRKPDILRGDRMFEFVGYGMVETPWGFTSPAMGARKNGGIGFTIKFFRPSLFSVEKWAPLPEAGDVTGVIIRGNEVVRESTPAAPIIDGWLGSTFESQGNLSMAFEALPPDLSDYWIRVDMLGTRHWFLIPYGLCGLTTSDSSPRHEGATPERPPAAAESDTVHRWVHVNYELGKISEKDWSVSLIVRDTFTIELYHEKGGWSLSTPRTSIAYLPLGGVPRFGSLTGVSRENRYDMRRYDLYDFGQIPPSNRTWGLLRITVDDFVLEKVVPSSLFQYTYGKPDSE
ncbi:MAG: hypothetical protein K8I27_08310 [Planctomycetes bacterium]|nr:hypothetical protein [Planctomycetota bacterium]